LAVSYFSVLGLNVGNFYAAEAGINCKVRGEIMHLFKKLLSQNINNMAVIVKTKRAYVFRTRRFFVIWEKN
jgi:hypothetical protein